MAENDLSKIVGLIMENPSLIEEIKKLAAQQKNEDKKEEKPSDAEEVLESVNEEPEAHKSSIEPSENINRVRRRDLLSALKPYVSEERGRAIDSMMSITDILDMMRSK